MTMNLAEVRVLRPTERREVARKVFDKSREASMPDLAHALIEACVRTINQPRSDDFVKEADNEEVRVLLYQRTAYKLNGMGCKEAQVMAIVNDQLHEYGWRFDRKDIGGGHYRNSHAKVWLVLQPLKIFAIRVSSINIRDWQFVSPLDARFLDKLKTESPLELRKRLFLGVQQSWQEGICMLASVYTQAGRGEVLIAYHDDMCHYYSTPGMPRLPIEQLVKLERYTENLVYKPLKS